MIALPPYSTFFLKTVVIFIYRIIFRTLEVLAVSFFIFLGLCGYMSYFHNIYLGYKEIYVKEIIRKNFYIIPLLIFFLFFF